ncbi:response regulator [Rhodoplanes roseus]|uniref:response regulator n=1 Tax=Rhodoplanes roseus TaxID=29409 RepID=UPI001472FA68|nr:response regulator [Rhodoplanes roseus]
MTIITETAGRDEIVILCADEETRDILAFWFGAAGQNVVVARDGHHANRSLRSGRCRLLVTDRVLPPWPGLDTILSLRARDPALAVAVVETGNPDERILARVTGATALLRRPLSRDAVLGLLAAARSQPDTPARAQSKARPSAERWPSGLRAHRLRTDG